MKRTSFFLSVLLSTVSLLFAMNVRLCLIYASLPYLHHVDETVLMVPASAMLRTGDLNPHSYLYPSLPIYLTAAGITAGFFKAASNLEIKNTSELGRFDYPYYTQPGIAAVPKILFAFLSVLTMAFAAILAYKLSKSLVALVLCPWILFISQLFLQHSAKYLNVDIVGCFFATATLLYCILTVEKKPVSINRCLIPGILAGLTIASKYNFLPILVAPLLVLWTDTTAKDKALSYTFLFLAISFLTFLVVVPYSLLDFRSFIDGIAFQMYHYTEGHAGFNKKAGLPQFLSYLNSFSQQFGLSVCLLAVAGIIWTLKTEWKSSLVLLLFSFLCLLAISRLRVRFERNVLEIHVILSVYAAVGFVAVSKWLLALAERYAPDVWWKRPWMLRGLIFAVLIGFILCTLPWKRITSAYNMTPDSRNLAKQWILAHLPPESTIAIPEELDMDTRGLEKRYNLIQFTLSPDSIVPDFNMEGEVYVLDPIYELDGRGKLRGWRGKLKEVNESFDSLQSQAAFGSSSIIGNAGRPVAFGDPRIQIRKVK
jgi:hypothetical protein